MLYGRICAACPPQEHSPSGYRDAFLELRGVFDAFFSMLLEGDIRSFGSQYSRVVYACRKYDVAADIQRAAVAFRHRSASFAEKTDAHAGELAVAASTLAYVMDRKAFRMRLETDILSQAHRAGRRTRRHRYYPVSLPQSRP